MSVLDDERQRLARLFDVAPSRILHALSAVGVADEVPAEGIGLGELAARLATDPERLARLVLAAQTLDVCQVDDTGTIRLTTAGMLLRSDQPGSLRAEFSDNSFFVAWGPFTECVLGGRPSYELAHGAPVFDKIAEDPRALAAFHEHMRMRAMQLYRPLLPFLLKRCSADTVDVAGGTGGLAELLLSGSAALSVTVTDLPGVIALVPPQLAEEYGDRVVTLAADMHEQIPQGHGTYLLASVLHDWNDEQALRILHNCARAMRPDSELVLLERVLKWSGQDTRRMGDIWMMAMTGGKERTQSQWAEMAVAAGLVLRTVHNADSELSAVVLALAA